MHSYVVEGKVSLVRLFVRGDETQSDLDLLRALGLGDFTPVPVEGVGFSPPSVIVGNSDKWVVIADCGTLLYHPHDKQNLVAKLAHTYAEAFWCALPDTDDTFKFDCWHKGELRRSYHLSPVGWTGEQTLAESGTPFGFEAQTSQLHAEDQPLEIGRRLGFDTADAAGTFRAYIGSPVERKPGDLLKGIWNIPREIVALIDEHGRDHPTVQEFMAARRPHDPTEPSRPRATHIDATPGSDIRAEPANLCGFA
ncbi:MAG: hypothetical protein ACI8TP_004484 [Acidimicrobiales bacterium]|jgi:hypothetical protein